jgi:hypothetical protein
VTGSSYFNSEPGGGLVAEGVVSSSSVIGGHACRRHCPCGRDRATSRTTTIQVLLTPSSPTVCRVRGWPGALSRSASARSLPTTSASDRVGHSVRRWQGARRCRRQLRSAFRDRNRRRLSSARLSSLESNKTMADVQYSPPFDFGFWVATALAVASNDLEFLFSNPSTGDNGKMFLTTDGAANPNVTALSFNDAGGNVVFTSRDSPSA